MFHASSVGEECDTASAKLSGSDLRRFDTEDCSWQDNYNDYTKSTNVLGFVLASQLSV